MRKEIEEFKKRNGNESFSMKEMTMYLITKVDKVEEAVTSISNNHTEQYAVCTGKFISRNTFWKLFAVVVIVIGSLYGIFFSHMIGGG